VQTKIHTVRKNLEVEEQFSVDHSLLPVLPLHAFDSKLTWPPRRVNPSKTDETMGIFMDFPTGKQMPFSGQYQRLKYDVFNNSSMFFEIVSLLISICLI